MSQLFGTPRRLGYVVRDIQGAMRYWTEVMRIGPFYYLEHLPLSAFEYRGQPGEIDLSVALAYSGGLQVKLIQQRNACDSAYRDFLAGGNEGLHHIGYLTDHFERDLRLAGEVGMQVEQCGKVGNTGGAFASFSTSGHPGTALELLALTSENRDVFQMIQNEAGHWDGSGPIRHLDL